MKCYYIRKNFTFQGYKTEPESPCVTCLGEFQCVILEAFFNDSPKIFQKLHCFRLNMQRIIHQLRSIRAHEILPTFNIPEF